MKKKLVVLIALAMMLSITACTPNETDPKAEEEQSVTEEIPPPVEKTEEDDKQQEEKNITEEKTPVQPPVTEVKPQEPIVIEKEQQPTVEEQKPTIEVQPPVEEEQPPVIKEQPQKEENKKTDTSTIDINNVDEDGFINFGTIELPTETDGNSGGLENNWDTVGYRYKDGEIEEVMQCVRDYCDRIGFELNDDLTQFNSSWNPPIATVGESPNNIVERLKYQADEKVKAHGTGWNYNIGLTQEDGVEGYFFFLYVD